MGGTTVCMGEQQMVIWAEGVTFMKNITSHELALTVKVTQIFVERVES